MPSVSARRQPFAESLEPRRLFATSPLDATFNGDGLSTTSFDQFYEGFTRLTHADNGKIYAVGTIQTQWLVARFNESDGSLDTSFDGDGFKTLTIPNAGTPTAVIAQSDGKLLIAAPQSGVGMIARLTTAGALDTTWSGDGTWTVPPVVVSSGSIDGLQMLNGKLYAAGDNLSSLQLYRFNDDGTLDTTYGTGNSGVYSFLPAEPFMRPQAKGLELVPAASKDPFSSFDRMKLVFLGQYVGGTDTQTKGFVAEFYDDGTPATPFGTNGVASFPATGGSLASLAADDFGRIVIGGVTAQVTTVFRLTDHGALDPSFDGDGMYHHPGSFSTALVGYAPGTNRIVFAIPAPTGSAVPSSRLVALDGNGQLDPTFGTGGVFATGGMGRYSDAIPTSDGKVIFAGTVFYADDQRNTQLARVMFGPQAQTTISGSIFQDTDGDGVQDANESNYSGFGISAYLDLDGDGAYDGGEPTSYAGNTGNFSFVVNPGDTYTVRLMNLAAVDQRQTNPANNGGFTVTAVASQNTLSPAFGVQKIYWVPGYVFNDADGNGAWASGTEPTIAGRTVYADANDNGALDPTETRAVTDAIGRYVLWLPAGTFRLRQVLPTGWAQTGRVTDSIGSQFVANGNVAVPTDLDYQAVRNFYFGAQLTAVDQGSISGAVFNDANDNGFRDAAEVGLANVRVYIDANTNGAYDAATDPNVLTAADGTYTFGKLLAGTYTVRSIVAAGTRSTTPINNQWVVNLPTNGSSTNNYFGHTAQAAVSGYVFHDRNGNGLDDSGDEEMGAGWQVFLDANNNAVLDTGEISTSTDPFGTWTFHNLIAGTYVVRVIPQPGWRITAPASTSVTLAAGAWPVIRQTGVLEIPPQFPFKGTPFSFGTATPVTIQAEDYDLGGEGVAFHETTANNVGNVYRPNEPVDIKLITNTTNQYRISDAAAGEWVEYTIFANDAGNYELELRLSNTDPNAKVHVEIDGVNVTGSLSVPDTNNFSTFSSVKKQFALGAGAHVLRLAFDVAASTGSVAGVDWMKLAAVPVAPPPPPPGSTVTLNNTIAAYVRNSASATANFGNDAQLIVKTSATSGNTRESYLKFDVSSLPTDPNAITNVKLRVYGKKSASGTNPMVGVFGAANTTWAEGTLTWNNKPATSGGALASKSLSSTSNAWHEFDITNYVKQARQNGQQFVTLALRATNATDPQAVFNSDDASSNKPQLVAQTSGTVNPPPPPAQALVVTPDGLSVPEASKASFTVKLSTAPASDVTVTISRQAGSDTDVTSDKATLTFTPANWNVAQTVFLAAAADADSVNGQAFFSVASSGVETVNVLAVEADDDGQVSEPTIILGDGAYVRDGASAAQNFGTAADLIVKKSANAGNTRETYIKFDLTNYTSVTSAKLRLNAKLSDTTSASLLTNIYATTNTTWTETGLTWNNKPAAAATLRGSVTVSGTSATWYEIDLTSFIAAEIAAGRKIVTLVLKNPNTSDAQTVIASDDTANGPQLVVL